MLREFHHLRHVECEMKYLDSLTAFVERQEKSGFGGMNKYENVQFSTFDDKDKYSGSIPSGGYLTFVYYSMIQDLRPLMDQMISLLDGVVLKADHSFKIIDHMGKLNEMPLFTALYTVCNEYEEIRCQSLVATKHHSHLNSIYAGLVASYRYYGHQLPKFVFTDNVDGDQAFLESMIPTLKDNVTHIQRNNESSSTFPTDSAPATSTSEATDNDIEISPSSTVSAVSTVSTQNSNSTARLQEYTLPEEVRVHTPRIPEFASFAAKNKHLPNINCSILAAQGSRRPLHRISIE
ncbi:hypothetical protein [Parasitella parasitica]|uniref:Uncharacterized protein n=1 Tax=Parasitella parasitica TaxID=35722 RepID=A0A0B7NWX4_9FUNG|nr:hypothetical protein [Parasitella parasitica]